MQTIYPSKIEEDYFHEDLYDLYWRFVAERQNMYVRRAVLDLPRPWSADPILNSEFITNMYRELDPGTEYVIREILTMKSPKDRLFNVMMYRLMGSQADTHTRIRTTAKQFNSTKYMKALEGVEKGKLFGDAYRVAGYEKEGGSSKHENIGLLFTRIATMIDDIYTDLMAATAPREAYEVIKAVPGFGDFLAHQITVDLLYKNPDDQAVLRFGDDEWAMAGPGARNGMWALLKDHVKPRSLLLVMEYLRDHQEEQFAKRDIDFPYLANADGEPVRLSVCNIQSTLCEFFKYVRLWDGSTQKVRRYIPAKGEPHKLTEVPMAMTESELEAIGSLPCLTPPPPPGGRRLSEAPVVDSAETLPNAPEPSDPAQVELDRQTSVSVDLEAVNIPGELQSTSFQLPNGSTVTININFYNS